MIQQGQSGGNTVADKEIDYRYDAIGDVTGRSAFNFIGVGPRYDIATEAMSYNALGLLTGLSMTSHAGEVALDNLTYSYDTLARVSIFGSIDGTASYGYDPTSQLTSASYTAAAGEHVEPPNWSMAFDPNGNRTLVNASGTTVSPNNEVTQDAVFNYQFDADGNRTVRTRINSSVYATDYRTTYAWDFRNRLTDVETFDNDGVLTEHVHYVYDVWNHLIEREVDPNGSGTYTVDTHYVWDASAPPTLGPAGQPPNAPGNIVLAFNGSQQLTTRYLVGPNLSAYDQFLTTLAEEDVNSSGQTGSLTFDLQDQQGSLTDIADDDGNLADHLAYTAYGQVFNETNPSITHIAGYAGGLYDAATGLVYNIERWYDPQATVWISADPTGFYAGDTNLSRYVANDLTNAIDPSGLEMPADLGNSGMPALPPGILSPRQPPSAPSASPTPGIGFNHTEGTRLPGGRWGSPPSKTRGGYTTLGPTTASTTISGTGPNVCNTVTMNGNTDVIAGVLTASLENYPPGIYDVTVTITVAVTSDGGQPYAKATVFVPVGSGRGNPIRPKVEGLGQPQNSMQEACQLGTSPVTPANMYTDTIVVTVTVGPSSRSPTVAIIIPTVTGSGPGCATYSGAITVGPVTRLGPPPMAGMGGGF